MINHPRDWNTQEILAAATIATSLIGAIIWGAVTIRVHDDRLDKLEHDQTRLIDRIIEDSKP